MQLSFVILLVRRRIQHAMGFNEYNALPPGIFESQDKIRVKTGVLKESDALAPAQVA